MLVYVPKVIQWVGWVVCAHVLCIIPPLPKQAQAEQTSASSIERALPPRITAACVSAMLARLFCLLCFFLRWAYAACLYSVPGGLNIFSRCVGAIRIRIIWEAVSKCAARVTRSALDGPVRMKRGSNDKVRLFAWLVPLSSLRFTTSMRTPFGLIISLFVSLDNQMIVWWALWSSNFSTTISLSVELDLDTLLV